MTSHNEAQMREQYRFGDLIENIAASDENPIKRGYFISRGRKTGRMNPGPYIEYVDTVLGRKHKTPPDNVRFISRHQSVTEQMKPLVEAVKLAAKEIDDEVVGPIDAQISEEIRKEHYDAPDDFEHHVVLTMKGWRFLTHHIANLQALATIEGDK